MVDYYLKNNPQGINMNIQVNTDHNTPGSIELTHFIETSLREHFERYKNAITRIEVHLSDVNGGKTAANDKRCLLEARVANRQPVVVSHNADTVHQAFEAASEKLLRSLDTMVGKRTDRNSPKEFLAEEVSTEDTEDLE
jgi:ribosome-associated translation inhibitor RaiA